MTTAEIMALIERCRTAGGREEHHAYKEELERVLDDFVAAMNNANAEIFAIRQSVFDLVTERDALKAELSCLRNQGAELAALKKELEALSKMSRKPYPSAMPLGQERDQILRALGYADAAQRPSETKLRN